MTRRRTITTSLLLAWVVVVVCGFVVRVESTAIATQNVKGEVVKRGSVEKRRLGSFKFLFHYQSQNVTYSEWITLFTLCLAPLVVHLIANVPESIVLDGNPPTVIDYLAHYNPTSVIWRYYAILDTRVRSRAWSPEDMAAANAHFWTNGKWESSQAMRIAHRARLHMPPRAYNAPSHSYVDPLSGSAIKTVIATLQGAQALYTLASHRSPMQVFLWDLSLASIFQPFAILGLLRVPAAPWMSERFLYDYREGRGRYGAVGIEDDACGGSSVPMLPLDVAKLRDGSLQNDIDQPPLPPRPDGRTAHADIVSRNFHRASSVRGVLIRIVYFVALLGLAAWTTENLFPDQIEDKPMTATGFTHAVFYAFFLDVSVLIFAFYFFTGRSTTTVIPCLQQTWYKVYTVVVFTGMLVFMVVAALQTRKSWCGVWTTFPVMWEWGYKDWEPCPSDCNRLGVVGKVLGEAQCAI